MHRFLLMGGLCVALGACATAPVPSLSTCNGQHRRPANPSGSVLLSPAEAAKPAAAQAAPAASFAPCGDPS